MKGAAYLQAWRDWILTWPQLSKFRASLGASEEGISGKNIGVMHGLVC
jgi:hypothetical protein